MLKGGGFDYAFCGGQAIDLFLGYESRRHGYIDICSYWNDRDKIILFMQSQGFYVYEMLGGGRVHRITDVSKQMHKKSNICCFKEGCPLVKVYEPDESDCSFFTSGRPNWMLLSFYSTTGLKLTLNMLATGR